ncbi:MAG: cupin domain-containing protein [Desulfobulbaceae bacterium]|nr:cupin domain-containing protein [Desulfobulbaceae bacterium]
MKKKNLSEAPTRIRNGLVSHILLQQGDTQSNNLAITWVEIQSGHNQQPHSHAPEQAYVIVSGVGRMQVGDEVSDVHAGDLVFIPSNVIHSMENIGTEKLVYISASVPAFDLEALYDSGQLNADSNARHGK